MKKNFNFNCRQLTKIGASRKTYRDFTSEGIKYLGYEYKGIYFSYSSNEFYFFIDFYPTFNNDLIYEDYKDNTEFCNIIYKYRMINDINLDEFKKDLDRLNEIIIELVKNAKDPDFDFLRKKFEEETVYLNETLRRVEESDKWENLDGNTSRQMKYYIRNIKTSLENISIEDILSNSKKILRDIEYQILNNTESSIHGTLSQAHTLRYVFNC